jgi:hypothetical protein
MIKSSYGASELRLQGCVKTSDISLGIDVSSFDVVALE